MCPLTMNMSVILLPILGAPRRRQGVFSMGMSPSSEPSVELVTKGQDGSLVQSRVVKSVVDAHNLYVDPKHALPPTVATSVSNTKHITNNYNLSGSKDGLHSPLRTSFDKGEGGKSGNRMYRGTDWGLVETQLSRDPVSAFCEVPTDKYIDITLPTVPLLATRLTVPRV